ncbi:hypothetical protein INT45_013118 [Circinella minor]|uniref:Myb-like domain-containing protein n=1 Tax=Circinella minor TaxID=1195481 RepID=A0A8H7S4T4_9FUNG|nr:hypothetical protein INT45_013118 [Circinella minor]
MDIEHLLCQPTTPSTATTMHLGPPKPQEPMIDRMPVYSSPEYYGYCSRDYWNHNSISEQQHYHHYYDSNDNHHHGFKSCRSNSMSSTNSMPPSPPLLVRSRTTSDASSQASASPREWAYPATPRDEDNTMVRLGYEPYYLVSQQTSPSSSSCYISSNHSKNHNNNYNNNVVPDPHIPVGGGRYRAPSHGSSVSSRRSRSTSASSINAPVQTRMAWTPTEDDLLQQGYDEGLSWAMISATYLPHRSRGCCWGRFKTLQSKNLVDPKRQNARLFRRPWKAVDGSKRQQQQPH